LAFKLLDICGCLVPIRIGLFNFSLEAFEFIASMAVKGVLVDLVDGVGLRDLVFSMVQY